MIGYRRGYQLQQLADLTLPSVVVNEKVPMIPGIGDGQTSVFSFSDQEVRLSNSYGQTEDGYGMKPVRLKYGEDYQVMINGGLVDRERLIVDTLKGNIEFKYVPFIKSGTSKQQPPKSVPKTIPFEPINKLKPEVPVYQVEATILNDPMANFKRSGVKPGMHIQNLTTGTTGEIIAPASGDSELVTWTRVLTTATVVQPYHGYAVNDMLIVVQSSDSLVVPSSGAIEVVSVSSDGNSYTFTCQDAGSLSGTMSVGIPSDDVGGTVLFSSNPGLIWQDKDNYQIISDEHSPAQTIEGEITETFLYLYDDSVDFLSEGSEKEADGFVWVQKVRVGDTLVKNPGPEQIEGVITSVSNHTLEAAGLQWQPGDSYKVYRRDTINTDDWVSFNKVYQASPLRDTNNENDVLEPYETTIIRNCAHWYDAGWKDIWMSTDYDFLAETWGSNRSWSGQISWYRHTAECTAGSSTGRLHPGMKLTIPAVMWDEQNVFITKVLNNQLELSGKIRTQFGIPFAVSAKINLGRKGQGQAGLSGIAKDPTPGIQSATGSIQLFNGKVNFNNVEWSSGVFAPVTPGMYIENLTNPQDGLIDFVGSYLEATNSTTESTKARLNTYNLAVQGIQGVIVTGGQNVTPNIQEQLDLAEIPPAYTVPATLGTMLAAPYVVTTNAVGTIPVPNTNPALFIYFAELKLDMYKNLGLDKLNKMLWRVGDRYRITKQAEKTVIKFKIEGVHVAPQVFSPENFLQDNDINFLIRGVHLGMKIVRTNNAGNADGIITLVEQHRIQAVLLDDPSKFMYWDVGDIYTINGEMAVLDPEKPMTQLYDNFTDFTQELKPYLEKGEVLYLKNIRTGHQGKITKVQKNILEAVDGYGPNLDDGYGHAIGSEKGPLLWYDGYGEEPYEISGTLNTNAPKNGEVLTCSYCTRDVTTFAPDFSIQKLRNNILTYSTTILPTHRRLGRSFTSSQG